MNSLLKRYNLHLLENLNFREAHLHGRSIIEFRKTPLSPLKGARPLVLELENLNFREAHLHGRLIIEFRNTPLSPLKYTHPRVLDLHTFSVKLLIAAVAVTLICFIICISLL